MVALVYALKTMTKSGFVIAYKAKGDIGLAPSY